MTIASWGTKERQTDDFKTDPVSAGALREGSASEAEMMMMTTTMMMMMITDQQIWSITPTTHREMQVRLCLSQVARVPQK